MFAFVIKSYSIVKKKQKITYDGLGRHVIPYSHLAKQPFIPRPLPKFHVNV